MSLSAYVQKCLLFKPNSHLLSSVYCYSTGKLREIDTKLETAARGTGYWSSFNGITCTVFGASGCIGRAVVNRLANRGTQVIVPYRGDPYIPSESKPAGDLGQLLFTPFHLEDEESIRRAVKYSDVVINLIGSEINTLNFTIERTNVVGARRIAKIAREMGVKKLIHFSALGASPNPKEIWVKGGSKFMKSKWMSELAVREEFPEAIIVRPSECCGEFDRYFCHYGAYRSYIYGTMYLWNKGMDTVKQPIYIPDVAAGVYELVVRHADDVKRKTYQFVGPRKYLLHDVVKYMMDIMWKTESFGFAIDDARTSIHFPLYRYWHELYINSPRPKYFLYWEHFEIEHTNEELDPNLPTILDLGVKLTKLENVAPQFLYCYREESTYMSDPCEFEVQLPPVLAEIK